MMITDANLDAHGHYAGSLDLRGYAHALPAGLAIKMAEDARA